jgi:hypothetical protein
MNELILAGGFTLFVLLVASIVAHRSATATQTYVDSGDTGECSGDDCRECALLFRHPSQAPVRRVIAERLPRQTRGGAL